MNRTREPSEMMDSNQLAPADGGQGRQKGTNHPPIATQTDERNLPLMAELRPGVSTHLVPWARPRKGRTATSMARKQYNRTVKIPQMVASPHWLLSQAHTPNV